MNDIKEQNQLIVALDNDPDAGMELVNMIECSPDIAKMVYGYKVSSLWLLEFGLQALYDVDSLTSRVRKRKVILDMQKWPTDVPSVVTKQVDLIGKTQTVDELIGCPMGAGSESLKTFIAGCRFHNIEPIIVLEMTHPYSNAYLVTNSWMSILVDSGNLGVKRFVIPATKAPRPAMCGSVSPGGSIFYTTGLKTQGGEIEPMRLFGVSKFIMGSAIYSAKNPLEAIEGFYAEINGVKP